MGVPKFFRYISERYPCLSEVVREYQIPEFDNLYLDMNGIIHMCSHPDDENVHFRITEEQIFKDIFHYIEILFRMIKPQKLFFMAVDGVAPRAKMNQQRGRRFRSAKDAEKREEDAAKKGEVLPEEARFDSNCITPGTVFMARLHEQLKYFVVEKISNDVLWQQCKVILSGHETPGEGEHKIMDYIRYLRTQPGYDPNTRHCLYGLDADLIMLGLCTHEPHFCLLREEVKFGRKSTKRVSVPEETTFYLLHLSIMREYLELEFADLKESLTTFEFDVEKIIDDWVLMGFLVGNDFIPHLPNLHITNGALPFLYKAYMEVLPSLGGYINEGGKLNLTRFEKFMQKLGNFDFTNFEEVRDDLLYMEAKTGRKQSAHTKVTSKPIENSIHEFKSEVESSSATPRDSGLAALIQTADDFAELSLEEEAEMENEAENSEDEAFTSYKREYYQNKLEFVKVTPEVMRQQAEGYVRAIQWNLNYYYNGCCSWSWYYPHHYAPYISDIKGFSNLDLKFDLGKPFLPFQQLLAVLPPASKNLLPFCYHDLMTKEYSIIKKYYPEDFETDLNGKKQEWEAVVLVPFIDENLLLEAMMDCNDQLTQEEVDRNRHGPMLIYTYTPIDKGAYNAPQYFPLVNSNHTEVELMMYDDVLIPEDRLIKGAYPGARMDVFYPGFPTMKHLKYKGELKIAQIKVFEHASRGENMIITIIPKNELMSGVMIPVDLLGTNVFVKWPHLIEAKVVAISNSERKYVNIGPNQYDTVEQKLSNFKIEIDGIAEFYARRMGINVGETKVLVYVQTLMGKKYSVNSQGKLILEKQFTSNVSCYPLQAIVYDIKAYEKDKSSFREIEQIFPKNAKCFTLSNPYYGSQGIIQENLYKKNGRIKIMVTVQEEPDFTQIEELRHEIGRSYKTLHTAASQLAVSNNLFSRITGSVFVKVPADEGSTKNVNIGLDLKMNKKNLETPGYTRKINSTWYYSDKAAELVRLYCDHFPEVFEYLAGGSNLDNIDPEDIFGSYWEDKVNQLKEWLRSLPTYKMQRQVCGTSVLEPEVVKEIENTIINFKSNKVKNVTMQIKPNFVYRPEIQSGTLIPDPKMDVRLLDRIVNVRCGYSVPFGLKGTVTAIQEPLTGSDRDTMYDVVFDMPFKNGMKMNCCEERGYRLPKYSFINISYGLRLMERKSGKPDDVITASQNSLTHNQYSESKEDLRQKSSFHYSNQQYNASQKFGQPNSAFAQFSSHSSRQSSDHHEILLKPKIHHQDIETPGYFNGNSMLTPFNETSRIPYPFTERNKKTVYRKRQDQMTNGSINLNRKSDGGSSGSSGNAVEKRQKVNVDFLKNLLSIDNSSEYSQKEKQTQSSSKADGSTNQSWRESLPSKTCNEEMNSSTTVSFDQLSQVANAPASIRLLTYYQSNGLGLPRYQYFENDEGLQAQITLSDGRLIVGKPAETREEASENVAANVLDLFVKNKSDEMVVKDDFPTPPETWVQSEKNAKVSCSSDIQTSSTLKTDTITVLSNSFVPLQAVKSHINKSNKQIKDFSKENVQNVDNISEKNVTMAPSAEKPKPKKERKTRIAANFSNKSSH